MFPQPSVPWLPGWYHLALFGVILPLLVLRSHRRLAGGKDKIPQRLKHFRSTALMLALFTGLSLWVANTQRIELFSFDRQRLPAGLLAGLAMYAAAVAFMRPRWRRAVERRAPIVHLFMPVNAGERAWWVLVSLLAGVGEEITWRGTQTALLLGLGSSYWAAALVSAISFGGAHFIQGWRSVLVVVVFGLGFQAVVFASGSLYVAMLVHVAYDVTAGLMYGKLGRAAGYALPEGMLGPGARQSQ